jgi:hypothetical protein
LIQTSKFKFSFRGLNLHSTIFMVYLKIKPLFLYCLYTKSTLDIFVTDYYLFATSQCHIFDKPILTNFLYNYLRLFVLSIMMNICVQIVWGEMWPFTIILLILMRWCRPSLLKLSRINDDLWRYYQSTEVPCVSFVML